MNKVMLAVPVMLTLSLALAGCDQKATLSQAQQSGPEPSLPKAQDFLIPPLQVPTGVGWTSGATPQVAPDLKIERIAGGLMHPRNVYTLPNGDILVAESNSPGEEPITTPKQVISGFIKNIPGKGRPGGNRITLLRKAGDGWEKHTFIENLKSPFGIQLIGDSLYVSTADDIRRFPYQTGETHISTPGTVLADLPDTINHHWTKAMEASADGKKLYVGVGSNSNITENGLAVEYRRANVLEVDVATGASRIYASGLRNPSGLAINPQSGRLWAVVNERDEIGADLVPDYMTAVQDGGFYGWPWSYFGKHVDNRVQPPRPDMVAKAIKPDYALGSHVAPLGILFYTGSNLPQKYRDGAFISEHGSFDRIPLSGYRVSFVAFKNGQPVGKPEMAVGGFVSKDEKSLYGAPVGLTQDKDGALIVADDVGDSVWRVTAK
ncbi:sorbosone dehydrogenase family protein [uncultured Pluralibacter sp.]|uniref:PQQ-dependent sugar dehydrogenase n=1 Tax=uncultured Pluralibacter sp. TaxID=1490864 RepID=UPI0026125668|nr:sorbosone dehydrogenase family protein [uncultured Pluralibacter sp.]